MAVSPVIHDQILDAVQEAVEELTFDGGPLPVYRRLLLTETWLLNVRLPCIVVSGIGIEAVVGGSNNQDDLDYPVTIRVVDRAASADETREPFYFSWRKTIRDALNEARLTDVPEVQWLRLQPSPTVEEDPLKYQILSMPLIFLARTRELRSN